MLSLTTGALAFAGSQSLLAQSRVNVVMDLESTVPVNTYKNKSPFTAKVISQKRIVGPTATGETCHIIMNHDGKMPYWEGQSYGVIPPGTNPKNGKPNSVRLYSIASSRYGDDMTGT